MFFCYVAQKLSRIGDPKNVQAPEGRERILLLHRFEYALKKAGII
jgi:hypothetical protein